MIGDEVFKGGSFVIKLISIVSGGMIFDGEVGVSKSWKKSSDEEEFIEYSDILSVEVVDELDVLFSALLAECLKQLKYFKQPLLTSFFDHGIRFFIGLNFLT